MSMKQLDLRHNAGAAADLNSSCGRTASAETVWIAAICMLDLVTTLFWVSRGIAREANPLMAHFLNMGAPPFVLVKVLTFLPAVVAAEWYRPANPVLVKTAMRWTIVLYLSAYAIGVAGHYSQAAAFYRALLYSWLG